MPQDRRADVDAALLQIGLPGLRHYGGYLDEEFLALMRQNRGVEFLKEMTSNDPTITGIQLRIETILGTVPKRVVPADASPEAIREADFVQSCRDDMAHTWQEFETEKFSVLRYGFAPFEICYKFRHGPHDDPDFASKHDDGRIGWGKLELRGQDTRQRWQWSDDGDLLGLWQYRVPKWDLAFIPLAKMILFRHRAQKTNPEGTSFYRGCATSYRDIKKLYALAGIGVERDLTGYPILEVPPEYLSAAATPEQKALVQNMLTQLTQMRRDQLEGAIFPSSKIDGKETGWLFRLVNSGGSRQLDIAGIIRSRQQDMALATMHEAMFLGMDAVGSFSMHSDKTALLMMALNNILDNEVETLNRQAIPPLMKMNGVPPHLWPRFEHDPVDRTNVTELAQAMQTLAATGFLTPSAAIERRMLELLNLPSEDEQTAEEAAAGGTAGGAATGAQSENVGLQIQYLSLASQRAVQAGDMETARIIQAKIKDLLMQMGAVAPAPEQPAADPLDEPLPPAPVQGENPQHSVTTKPGPWRPDVYDASGLKR